MYINNEREREDEGEINKKNDFLTHKPHKIIIYL